MRKNTLFLKTKTLEIKSCLLHLSFGFYNLFHCDLELMVEGQAYPCIRIVILLNSRKYYMLVPVPVSVVPVPICYWCFSTWGYRYRLVWYRYRFATGAFLLGGTGTGLSGIGTGWPLLISCFEVPVPVCPVPVPLPLHLLPNIFTLPKTSPQWLPSSSMIHIRFLVTNPCNNYA